MPLFEWSERFELGIKEIDQQHKGLMELVNNIYDQFKEGAAVPALKALLEVLMEDAKYHFECEEHWMKETFYPHLVEHREEHDRFKTRVTEINRLFSKEFDISLDLMLFLNNWIRHHLLEVDAKFADHVISRSEGAAKLELPFHLIVRKYLSS